MDTPDRFKNSPIHDKVAILELMDELKPEQMAKLVDYLQKQVKLFRQPPVIKNEVAVCEHPDGWIGITERSGEYYCEKCKQNFFS